MQSIKHINLPADSKTLRSLNCGEIITVSGTVFTARDAAHKRIAAIAASGDSLPFPLKDIAIYYCGPTPTRSGEIIGSCGPTTSARMDDYTPLILREGVKVLIGKGKRCSEVNNAIKQYGAVYLAAVGGAGALYQACVTKCECIAFSDLGCEAVYKLEVKDMPLVVATDSRGNSFLK